MAGERKNDKYINCSKCKSKYTNDQEHKCNDFGYTRLEQRYETRVRCRVRSKVINAIYHDKHQRYMK